MTSPTDCIDLEQSDYIALTTFRRDGSPVTTPVDFLRDGDTVLIQTGAVSGKVKRIEANSAVTITGCDVRGNLVGPTSPASAAVITDPTETRALVRAIRRRYGVVSRLIGVIKRDPGIVIRVSAPQHAHIDSTS